MRTIFLVGVGMLLVFAGRGVGGAPTGRGALQGTWVGKSDKAPLEFVLTIANDRWTLRGTDRDKGEDRSYHGSFTLNLNSRPRTIDMKIEGGKGDGAEGYVGKTALGIFEISGDTLRWCANEPGKEGRPTEFVSKEAQMLVEFKRMR